MRELTLLLEDEALYAALETEAATTGHTVQDIVVQALRQWQADSELDAGERDELAEARQEWEEMGGMEPKAFFDRLRQEEAGLDG